MSQSVMTFCATLPSSARPRKPRPCVPITIRFAFSFLAALAISGPGWPTVQRVEKAMSWRLRKRSIGVSTFCASSRW